MELPPPCLHSRRLCERLDPRAGRVHECGVFSEALGGGGGKQCSRDLSVLCGTVVSSTVLVRAPLPLHAVQHTTEVFPTLLLGACRGQSGNQWVPGRAGFADCWGDSYLELCALGLVSPSSCPSPLPCCSVHRPGEVGGWEREWSRLSGCRHLFAVLVWPWLSWLL